MAVAQSATAVKKGGYLLEGTLLEACSCGVLCPCWVGENPDLGECFAAIAWHYDKGRIGNVDVSGLTAVSITHIPGNILTPKSWRAVLFIDAKATDDQKNAIVGAIAGEYGGPLAAIAVAWALAVIAEATGHGKQFHHDTLIEGGLNPWAALGLFLISWQAMIAAMMLPSSLPLIGLFSRISAAQPNSRRVRAAFLAGYFVVWTVFGALALAGDAVIHRTVDSWPWLAAHSWLIPAGVLVGAGIFQLSPLKDACLKACR